MNKENEEPKEWVQVLINNSSVMNEQLMKLGSQVNWLSQENADLKLKVLESYELILQGNLKIKEFSKENEEKLGILGIKLNAVKKNAGNIKDEIKSFVPQPSLKLINWLSERTTADQGFLDTLRDCAFKIYSDQWLFYIFFILYYIFIFTN